MKTKMSGMHIAGDGSKRGTSRNLTTTAAGIKSSKDSSIAVTPRKDNNTPRKGHSSLKKEHPSSFSPVK
jgi:hypothetical protein